LVYGLTVVSALYGIRRYEMNRVAFKNQVKIDAAILKEKDETDKMKSRFFANISHEFRTPLTLIIGQAERISSNESVDIKKDSNTIKRNSKRLLQLINQLLDLSKIEAGKLKLEISQGNIVSLIKGVVFSFESLAASKNIILKIQAEKDFIEMYFDKEKMYQIHSNILSNAFKFTHENGKITVSISEYIPTANEKSPKYVEIKYRDTGIGIAPEEMPKLFVRFYQVDNSLTRENAGTGIGLSLTKEFIELHHGTIRVESKKEEASIAGSGWTEFIIRLPLGKDHLNGDEIIEQSIEPIPSGKYTERESETNILEIEKSYFTYTTPVNHIDPIKSSITRELMGDKTIILIVEDNYEMREYIKESLDKSYILEEAVNGEQGIRKAEKIIPDLIISDMMMPKADGNELVRILKNDEKTSHIPIILLTAKAGHEDKLNGLEHGADEYLTKPFDRKELQVRIKNLINTRKKLQEKYSSANNLPFGIKKDRLNSIDEKFMFKIGEAIEKHISEEEFDMEVFCSEMAMSRTQLHRKLKALTGKPASLYIRSVKLAKAKEMITEQQANISEIAYSLGFSSPAYFTRCFREEFGCPPSDMVK